MQVEHNVAHRLGRGLRARRDEDLHVLRESRLALLLLRQVAVEHVIEQILAPVLRLKRSILPMSLCDLGDALTAAVLEGEEQFHSGIQPRRQRLGHGDKDRQKERDRADEDQCLRRATEHVLPLGNEVGLVEVVVAALAHGVVGDDIGRVAGERVLDIDRLAGALQFFEPAAQLIDERFQRRLELADALDGEERVQLGSQQPVAVVVFGRDESIGSIERPLIVGVLVTRAVAAVDDFVVFRVVDVQFCWADADNRACTVSTYSRTTQ